MPHMPLSHPFMERVIGTVRRELLDHVPFWGARDLERKLQHFRDYHNHGRVHVSLKGVTPVCSTDRKVVDLDDYRWQSHCAGCISCLRPRERQFATHRLRREAAAVVASLPYEQLCVAACAARMSAIVRECLHIRHNRGGKTNHHEISAGTRRLLRGTC